MLGSGTMKNDDIVEVRQEQLQELKNRAMKSDLKRARICLHKSHDDVIQEMVIAFCKDSYVRPHRHLNKSESFHVIEGELMVLFFNDEGAVIDKLQMGPIGSNKPFMYRLNKEIWHSMIPLTEFVVLHEAVTGPFIKSDADCAGWSPANDDVAGIKLFLQKVSERGNGFA